MTQPDAHGGEALAALAFFVISALVALAAWAANRLETEIREAQQLDLDSKRPQIRKSLLGQRRFVTCEDIANGKKGSQQPPKNPGPGHLEPSIEKKITLRGGQPTQKGRSDC